MGRKLIVTSVSRLKSKYGEAGWKRVDKAVKKLVAGDKARGVETELVDLGGKALGKKAAKTGKTANAASFKTAIDQAFSQAGRPEYLVILGGPDVVPHQLLLNPAGDDDSDLPSDLPYASDAKASANAADFVAASRAVGRIPDLSGSSDPGFLVEQLERAAEWKPLTTKAYSSCFGLSAAEWQKSTTLSLQALFGKAAKPRLSPKEGPKWKGGDLSARAHFINCHGAPSDPQFYGQAGSSYPTAHHSERLAGLVKPGTVVAAECCYGAELYDPPAALSGICTTYLDEGAIGFMGSTTIAYGPADSNGSADLVCRYFLASVLGGASLGRALLAARQRFAESVAPLSPIDLKTIAQFHLLGDPSLHAIGTAATKAGAKARSRGGLAAPRFALESNAARLSQSVESVGSDDDGAAPADVTRALESAARDAGLVPTSDARTFEVRLPKGRSGASTLESAPIRAKFAPSAVKFHVMFAAPPSTLESAAAAKTRQGRPRPGQIVKKVCLLAREVNGSVREIERLWAHAGGRGDEGTVRRARRQETLRCRFQERARGGDPPD